LPVAEITIDSPPRPRGAKLDVEPASGIDYVDPSINVANSLQHSLGESGQNQYIESFHICAILYHDK
jgi:hypothetical protein